MKAIALLLVLAVCTPCTAQTPAYTVTDLGTLGGLSSTAAAVNNKGQVVGNSDLEDSTHVHAFFFDGSRLSDMGTLGGTDSTAHSINDKGQAVGQADIAGSELSHAYRWEKGTMSDLHILDAGNSEADGINNAGQIVGWSFVPFNSKKNNGTEIFQPRRVFLQTENALNYLPDPYKFTPSANAVNDSGHVIGSVIAMGSEHFSNSAITTDFVDCACIWQNKKITLLKSLGGQSSEARAVNSSDQIVGKAALRHDKMSHACLWKKGTVQDLGTTGGLNSQANAINHNGQIVGWSDASDLKSQHAFLYDNGKMIDLNTMIEHKYGWVLLEATGISDTGYICGTGVVDGLQHAFLLTPIVTSGR